MTNLSCLDLFCCQGGAGMGYSQAGYKVLGIDIEDQPRYPFAYGIDWMTADGLKEAIPPAYTRYLGEKAKEVINGSTP